jgi:predicted SAM-dependent methyltransferase
MEGINNMNLFPWNQDARVCELGGGAQPFIRPNVDIRKCFDAAGNPTVDLVADFNKPLPFKDNEWDGIFGKFMLEHISWRRIRSFVAEVYRILKPGGQAVFVTANLLEQARILVETPDWEEHHVGMIFGDQNYGDQDWTANAHFTGFSPASATKLFKEAGFDRIIIIPWPAFIGDMVIEVRKPKMERKELFDKYYFNGGHKVGGYRDEGYQDFFKHWITFAKIMELKPKSVIDIGCGRAYVLKRLQDAGIPVGGLEISRHCYLTRAIDNITTWDLCDTPWPIPDKYFDVCFSCATLEHIPEEYVLAVMKEIERVSDRGIHGIDFGHEDDGFDKTHCTLRNQEWWNERMPPEHKALYKEDLEKAYGDLNFRYIPMGDGKLKVNVASFVTMFHHGWINMDIINLEQYAQINQYKFHCQDCRNPLPFADETVDLMYSGHFLEHLTYDEGRNFLKECKRVMKPGATIRLIVPDAELLINKYKENDLDMFNEIGTVESNSQIHKLWSLLLDNHKSAYDYSTVKALGEEVGFKVERKKFRQGHSQIIKETLDVLPDLSLYVEMVK